MFDSLDNSFLFSSIYPTLTAALSGTYLCSKIFIILFLINVELCEIRIVFLLTYLHLKIAQVLYHSPCYVALPWFYRNQEVTNQTLALELDNVSLDCKVVKLSESRYIQLTDSFGVSSLFSNKSHFIVSDKAIACLHCKKTLI